MRKDYVQLVSPVMIVRLQSEKPTVIGQYVRLNEKGEVRPQLRRSKNTIGQCVKATDKQGNVFIITFSVLVTQ